MNNKDYIFWLEDPSILYTNNNYLDFIPQYKMTRIQKLNSLVRLAIYFLIINSSFNGLNQWNYLSISIIVLTTIIYFIIVADPDEKNKELDHLIQNKLIEAEQNKKVLDEINQNDDNEAFADPDEITLDDEHSNYEVDVGYYDPDGELKFNDNKSIDSNNINPLDIYKTDEIIAADKSYCKKPTEENPFMNYSISDFNNTNAPKACNVEDEEIKNSALEFLNKDLYRNTGDLYDLHNSQRQYYSLPNTRIPPNTTEFANWLYNSPQTCKENQAYCLRYEDLRFSR
jgi:hypothetical protein